MEKTNFHDEIAKNKLKSVVLMIFIFIAFLLLGYVISYITNPGNFFFVMIISIVVSISYILISYYNSDKIALASVGAKPASPILQKQLYDVIEGLSLASGLPMPKIYVMNNNQINAFASGRDPKHAVICVTTGCLEKLNKQELEGVLAHEMSHIANFDVRFMTLTAVMVGMISIASEIFLRSLWFSRSDDRENKNAILIVAGILLAILAPLFASLVQLAISRKREFGADATGVKFARSTTGLLNALKKIKNDQPMRVPKAMASLFLSDPFKRKFTNLFSTHPNLDDRIRILQRM